MIKIIKYFFLFVAILFLTSCGTREYLGFEKKKIRLKGERVPILKELAAKDSTEKKSFTEIILEDAIILSNWPQSYNSPSHLSINHISDSKLNRFKYLVSGAGERKSSKILSQPVIYNDLMFFLDAKSNVISFNLKSNKIIWKRNIALKNENNHNIWLSFSLFLKSLSNLKSASKDS